jgi:hypothetical protein
MLGPFRGVRVSCRAIIAVALCLATAGTFNVSPRPGAGTRDRDRVVRLTRSGAFRFDSPDAIPHSHEAIDPDAAFSSLVVGQTAGPTARYAAADAPHATAVAIVPSVGALPGPGASSAFDRPPSPEPGASPPGARPPARAPPFTA